MDTWITLIERHVSFTFICVVCGLLIKKHKLVIELIGRLNKLWWNQCADAQEPYQPIENGTDPIVPPARIEPIWRDNPKWRT